MVSAAWSRSDSNMPYHCFRIVRNNNDGGFGHVREVRAKYNRQYRSEPGLALDAEDLGFPFIGRILERPLRRVLRASRWTVRKSLSLPHLPLRNGNPRPWRAASAPHSSCATMIDHQ